MFLIYIIYLTFGVKSLNFYDLNKKKTLIFLDHCFLWLPLSFQVGGEPCINSFSFAKMVRKDIGGGTRVSPNAFPFSVPQWNQWPGQQCSEAVRSCSRLAARSRDRIPAFKNTATRIQLAECNHRAWVGLVGVGKTSISFFFFSKLMDFRHDDIWGESNRKDVFRLLLCHGRRGTGK